jgi:hypothetical protein
VILRDAGRVIARFDASGRLDQIAEREGDSPCAASCPEEHRNEAEDDDGRQDPGPRAGQTEGSQYLRDDDQGPCDDEGKDEKDTNREADEEAPSHPLPRELAHGRPRLVLRPPLGLLPVSAPVLPPV